MYMYGRKNRFSGFKAPIAYICECVCMYVVYMKAAISMCTNIKEGA